MPAGGEESRDLPPDESAAAGDEDVLASAPCRSARAVRLIRSRNAKSMSRRR
ncbi:hypothetical protein IOD13_00435 [Brevibacterium casei]|nr:hypothetical protein [Brevibacterium casei]